MGFIRKFLGKASSVKWLFYTILLGLVPILVRFLVSSTFSDGLIPRVVSTDIAAFGILVHISIMNEIEDRADIPRWKTVFNAMCLFFIICYTVVCVMELVGPVLASNGLQLKSDLVFWFAIVAAFMSCGLGAAVAYEGFFKSEVNEDE